MPWEIVAGDSNSDLILHVSRNNVAVQTVFGAMSDGMASLVDQIYSTPSLDPNNAGVQFVSNATSATYIPDRTEAAAVLEGAAQIAVVSGVPYLSSNIQSRVSDVIVDHNALFASNKLSQLGVWVTPFYGTGDIDGMDAGNFESGVDLSYVGAIFGLDYNISQSFRLGAALNLGSGSSESNGDFRNIDNNFDFFGGTLYGSYTNGAIGLTADLGYSSFDNEVEQALPASMGGKLNSKLGSNALSLGFTGRYRFVAGDHLNIAPHLGLRYSKISIDDADVKLAGGKVFETSVDGMNLFQIPLGVEFSSSAMIGSWALVPHADLGVLFTFGDTSVDSSARIADTNLRTGSMNADVLGSTTLNVL